MVKQPERIIGVRSLLREGGGEGKKGVSVATRV